MVSRPIDEAGATESAGMCAGLPETAAGANAALVAADEAAEAREQARRARVVEALVRSGTRKPRQTWGRR